MPSAGRLRLALGAVSLAAIGLELALMRGLSLRFWSHLAYMVISVALLGFGASGTAISLLRGRMLARPRAWLSGLGLAFAASIPLCWHASRQVPLDVGFLSWSAAQAGNVLVLELLMFVPFLLAGAMVGLALTDAPERLGGHYAANLLGSGAGAVVTVAAMHWMSVPALLASLSGMGFLGGAILLPWRRPRGAVAGVLAGAGLAACCWLGWGQPPISPYKMLAQVRTWKGTEVVYHTQGPLGEIDAVAGPAIHSAPGLALRYTRPLPPTTLLLFDGDSPSAVYDCKGIGDWGFLDWTTPAAAYQVAPGRPRVCIVGAGGGGDIGLALFHQAAEVVALEMNPQVIQAMTGPLEGRGGRVYRASGVQVVNQEARGYFAATDRTFDLIQLPPADAFGASGAGLSATQESYLYTVQSVGGMLDRLGPEGVLCLTRWARTPPRDELRAFDLAAQALRRCGLEPSGRLAMIRNWATVSVLAFRRPIGPGQDQAVRRFCRDRLFDLCYLPGLSDDEANLYHVLPQPYYLQAARALLGADRRAFLDGYLFDVASPTDDRPYFFRTFRWRAMSVLREQLHGTSRAFLEAGYLMLLAGLAQAAGLGAVLILLPLAPGIGGVRRARGKAATLAYFLLLGAGFMLLEMAFIQKLILYLAHPIYAAAAVIAGFLVFAGAGSALSRRWRAGPKRLAAAAAAAVVCLSLIYLLLLDGWLGLSQSQPPPVRFLVAAATIAPLAVAMGHLFPAGLRQVGQAAPALVPWAWAVNGFASVAATVAAPLAAMNFGFSRVALGAAGCYLLAGLVSRNLPEKTAPEPGQA